MATEIGEARAKWGQDVCNLVEEFANKTKDVKPFYIVYACKLDPYATKKMGQGVYRQTIKAYYHKPEPMLGILVWYVDHNISLFEFCPELSAPPDIPIDESLLSTDAEDACPRIMEQGKKLKVLLS